MKPARIRALRKRLGLSQRGLASLLRLRGDWAMRTVRRWEAADRPANHDPGGPAEIVLELLDEEIVTPGQIK